MNPQEQHLLLNYQSKPKMNFISVVIPTYNRSLFLAAAVESVLNQTYKDFELIVVDDGSTDVTKESLYQYKNKLTYLYQEHQGVSAARNAGIEASSGDMIAFLDSDDLWTKKKLEEQAGFMQRHSQAMISYTDEIWIRDSVRVNPMKKHAKYSGDIFEKCLPLCIVSPSSVMIQRKLFERVGVFDETLPICEDYDLWLRISAFYPIFFLKKKLIIKQGGHKDQLSKSEWGIDRYRVRALEKLLNQNCLSFSQEKMVREELLKKCTVLYKGYVKRGKGEADLYNKKIAEYQKNDIRFCD